MDFRGPLWALMDMVAVERAWHKGITKGDADLRRCFEEGR